MARTCEVKGRYTLLVLLFLLPLIVAVLLLLSGVDRLSVFVIKGEVTAYFAAKGMPIADVRGSGELA